jgi:HEPN domain-containing protein
MTSRETDARWLERVQSFLNRAGNKLDEAEYHVKKGRYPETVSASQECIELSAKSVCKLLTGDFPKEHWFHPNELWNVLTLIPEELRDLAYSKLYFYYSFWYRFYTTAKYGMDGVDLGPEKLIEVEEAQLALKHARVCRFAAKQLENFSKRSLPQYETLQR